MATQPFGKKSSVTIVNSAGETEKESLVIIGVSTKETYHLKKFDADYFAEG